MLLFYLSLLDTEEEKTKFSLIYEKYKGVMKYVAWRILGDEGIAEDAVQEAFIKIIDNFKEIDEIDSNKTEHFCVIIVRNVSLDFIKKEKKIKLLDIDEIYDARVSSNNIEISLSVREIYERIKLLPEIYRDIIELEIYYGADAKEIARLLGISYGTARKRIQRARDALNKLLEK